MNIWTDIKLNPLQEPVKAPLHLLRKSKKEEVVYQKYLFAKEQRKRGLTLEKIAEMLNMNHWDIVYYLNNYKPPKKFRT